MASAMKIFVFLIAPLGLGYLWMRHVQKPGPVIDRTELDAEYDYVVGECKQ